MNLSEKILIWQTVFIATQTFIAVIAIYCAYQIGKKQNEISKQLVELGNTVELCAQLITNSDLKYPRIGLYNTGSRIFFIDKYLFNGKDYLLNGEARPPCSSNIPNNFYFVELPTDATTHVSLEVFFRDSENRKWKTMVYADKRDFIPWLVTTLRSERY